MARVELATYVETGRQPHWKAGIWSGVIAGVVFLVLEMVMVALFAGESPWGPVRMMGAILLGEGVLPPPATFDFGVVMAAMFVHFALAIILGLVLAYLVFRLTFGTALAVGLAFGLVVYLFNFYIMTGLFPWFAMGRNWITIFAHLAFGLTLAWSYKALARREVEHELEA